jgi:hypothetical protein
MSEPVLPPIPVAEDFPPPPPVEVMSQVVEPAEVPVQIPVSKVSRFFAVCS